jgi:beta-lactamase regulating signal transducer with metallopeptidase domain
MPEDLPNEPSGQLNDDRPDQQSNSTRNRRSSRSSSKRHSSSSGRRVRSAGKKSSKTSFTIAQGLLLVWSAGTLGGLLYLMIDVNNAPLSAILALVAAAILGLYFFFRGMGKKKKRR